ncbi:MAG TPA: helix-turn-helix transcriptional regulator [Pseudolabrys sp.]|nr:helix-turn-helix transcriptional regulator [Pseudolabrys sp.]
MPKETRKPIYRQVLDDAPRPVAARGIAQPDGYVIPLHVHKRGQLLHAITGIMRVETPETAWILPPARAIWLPPGQPHQVTMRGWVEMRTLYIDPDACATLPAKPVMVEISGLLRELILAALDEPADYREDERGGIVAKLILTELGRLRERRMDVPMPHDERALRVARALLKDASLDLDLDAWAEQAGASRRTLARLFRSETGLSFAEWRARLRAVDGMARLASGLSVAEVAAAVGYASPSAFSAMIKRNLGRPPRALARGGSPAAIF